MTSAFRVEAFRVEAFRVEVRDWLAAHVPDPPLPSLDTAEGFERHRAWERELAAAGLAVVTRVGQNGLSLLAPTLFTHGSDEQRDRLLPPMACADEVWAQAWSEPDAGSDLAAIRSRAVRASGGCCRAPRRGPRGRRSRTGRSGCSGRIRPRSGTGG